MNGRTKGGTSSRNNEMSIYVSPLRSKIDSVTEIPITMANIAITATVMGNNPDHLTNIEGIETNT